MPAPEDYPAVSPLLRPRDQTSVGVLVGAALVLMAAYWWSQGGHRGGLIEIDRAPPLEAKFQVDLNQADWPELIQLPGVGPTLAKRVVADRDQRGAFRSPEDLLRVHGIGPRTLESIRPYLLPVSSDGQWANR